MEQNFQHILKQLIVAAMILILVTALSFGIRQVRFSTYRADSGQSTPSPRPLETKDQSQPKQLLYTNAESDYYPEDSYIADIEPVPQDTDESFWDEHATVNEYAEAKTNSVKKDKSFSKTKSFKGDFAKVKDSKGLKKISLSDHEDLFLTKEGEYWYVSEQPNGKVTKTQVKIDDDTGELIAIGGGEYAKQEPQRIPIGDNEDIYLTDEGEAWYVSEQPDGSTAKVQLPPD